MYKSGESKNIKYLLSQVQFPLKKNHNMLIFWDAPGYLNPIESHHSSSSKSWYSPCGTKPFSAGTCCVTVGIFRSFHRLRQRLNGLTVGVQQVQSHQKNWAPSFKLCRFLRTKPYPLVQLCAHCQPNDLPPTVSRALSTRRDAPGRSRGFMMGGDKVALLPAGRVHV